jgi:hypothetical protein
MYETPALKSRKFETCFSYKFFTHSDLFHNADKSRFPSVQQRKKLFTEKKQGMH